MGTIFIHHHVQDRFAAEIIAGTLVDCGEVAMRPHRPFGERHLAPERVGVDWHVVLWTPRSAGHAPIIDLVDTLARFRGPLMVLTYDTENAPGHVRPENTFPLLDRSVEWSVYRAGLRQRLQYAVDTYPHGFREGRRIATVRTFERTLYTWMANIYFVPALIIVGVLVWTRLPG